MYPETASVCRDCMVEPDGSSIRSPSYLIYQWLSSRITAPCVPAKCISSNPLSEKFERRGAGENVFKIPTNFHRLDALFLKPIPVHPRILGPSSVKPTYPPHRAMLPTGTAPRVKVAREGMVKAQYSAYTEAKWSWAGVIEIG